MTRIEASLLLICALLFHPSFVDTAPLHRRSNLHQNIPQTNRDNPVLSLGSEAQSSTSHDQDNTTPTDKQDAAITRPPSGSQTFKRGPPNSTDAPSGNTGATLGSVLGRAPNALASGVAPGSLVQLASTAPNNDDDSSNFHHTGTSGYDDPKYNLGYENGYGVGRFYGYQSGLKQGYSEGYIAGGSGN